VRVIVCSGMAWRNAPAHGLRAQVGFHAAYDGQTHQVTSSGNALVGAYLNKIGLPYSGSLHHFRISGFHHMAEQVGR